MKKLTFLAAAIVLATAICVLLGFAFQVPDNEKQQGLTGVYDVADTGTIGFVSYEAGKPTLYVKSDSLDKAAQLSPDQAIHDVVMMPEGKTAYYVTSDKTLSGSSRSAVHQVDLTAGTDEVVFEADAIITDLAVDADHPDRLYYLQAGVFENYSPIASERPHDFDIHRYEFKMGTTEKLTDLKKYSMASLQVSGSENAVYVQMDDDSQAETAEEIFQTNQRIFRIPIDRPDQQKVLFMPKDLEDIYDFALIPEHSLVVYQAVAGTDENGTYEYELFGYNWDTMKTERLTFKKENAARPVYGADQKLYYMMDDNFGGRKPEYTLFRMDLDGTDTEQVPLLE